MIGTNVEPERNMMTEWKKIDEKEQKRGREKRQRGKKKKDGGRKE